MMNAATTAFPDDWKFFIDNFPDHIARYGTDFTHLYINRAIENEIQMPAAQVVGKSNRDLRIPDNDKALNELEHNIQSVFETGLPATYYTRHTFPEGTKYYYMKLSPGFADGAAQVESVWAITREITTLKQYEKKLRQSRKALQKKNQQLDEANANLDTFFYTVSHDLRNPLANIKAAVNLLKKAKQDQQEPLIGLLEQSTGRMNEILTDLTKLIQLESQQEMAASWAFDSVLSAIRTEFSQQLAGVGGEILADFSACPAVSYPKPYLDSLFRNLISNAIKYRAPDQALQLAIAAHREDGFVVITFGDNGRGIDLARNSHKLFKPFYQVDPRQEGSGMGLHIVKSMLQKNGGKIEVSSQPGQGTTFTAYLKEY